ncbi:uncharacterized protein [Drosophila bipectinata]|uniref:uncharacterized protein n=1 Tax=Drosophila bipectinata TaxID=42026 RepID=UPI001C8A5678|nr:uncharacterized protein LOC108124052 [Drosophila bipectinata]
MLKWTASAQRLNEMPAESGDAAACPSQRRQQRRQRRQRRATIANKENVPDYIASTPMPVSRLRNSPLVLAPLSDIRNITPESLARSRSPAVQRVQSVRYATTLPMFAEDYSPNGVLLPTGQHLALRGLAPLDPFLGQPRYINAAGSGAAAGVNTTLKKRKLDADFVATMDEPPPAPATKTITPPRPVTPQPATTSSQMGDQTLDRLIDAILDSACKSKDASAKKKPRRSTFNLRRRTLVKQQLDAECARVEVLSPSYAPGDDPASDLSFGLVPIPTGFATPEPGTPVSKITHNILVQLPTPLVGNPLPACPSDNTFCLETPVRKLKRGRAEERFTAKENLAKESPLKRYKVDERNYFEVGLALPSSIYV